VTRRTRGTRGTERDGPRDGDDGEGRLGTPTSSHPHPSRPQPTCSGKAWQGRLRKPIITAAVAKRWAVNDHDGRMVVHHVPIEGQSRQWRKDVMPLCRISCHDREDSQRHPRSRSFLKGTSAIVRATCQEQSDKTQQRGRSHFAPEPASRTRPRKIYILQLHPPFDAMWSLLWAPGVYG